MVDTQGRQKQGAAPIGWILERGPTHKLAVPMAVAGVGILPSAADLDSALIAPSSLGQVPPAASGCKQRYNARLWLSDAARFMLQLGM